MDRREEEETTRKRQKGEPAVWPFDIERTKVIRYSR